MGDHSGWLAYFSEAGDCVMRKRWTGGGRAPGVSTRQRACSLAQQAASS
jgi:hypothetical protein